MNRVMKIYEMVLLGVRLENRSSSTWIINQSRRERQTNYPRFIFYDNCFSSKKSIGKLLGI